MTLGYEPGLYAFSHGNVVEKKIPALIVWSHEGTNVSVEGSWDNWTSREPMQKVGKDFTIMKVLPCGVYQLKFLVDGKWRFTAEMPAVYDERGQVSNVLDVQEYVPENLDGIAAFDPPRSPDSSYGDDSMPAPEDFSKEPPLLPPHLQLTLLNGPCPLDGPNQGNLSRPPHVILNHTYVDRGNSLSSVMTLGLTHRFRSKFVTVVLILFIPPVTARTFWQFAAAAFDFADEFLMSMSAASSGGRSSYFVPIFW
ncbi:hypothetical protein R1sor_020886 [Riccia sorocarpa]|uniref:Association with the SNF1 complex (ASC) domain-containing protein n=1 Tax=Riccia sorocarpa TaxID=122646 RepID=A0ABD3GIL9_9MARC